jgi:hypothetical protein
MANQQSNNLSDSGESQSNAEKPGTHQYHRQKYHAESVSLRDASRVVNPRNFCTCSQDITAYQFNKEERDNQVAYSK